jgi:2'-5' RNA ligase
MKYLVLIAATILNVSYAFAASKVVLSKSVYKGMPFSSQFIEDGALIRNVEFTSVNALVPQIEKQYGVKLKDRGESHITVITPPEAQGWFTDHKGLNFFISPMEIQKKYFSTLQKTRFKIHCIGKRENKKGNLVFFLVVASPDLLKVRKEIQRELERRARFTGMKAHFDAAKYWPHITIGFVGGDVHGVTKGPETCDKNLVLSIR